MSRSIRITTFFSLIMNTKFSTTLSKHSRRLKRALIPESPVLPVSIPSTNSSIVHEEVHSSTTVGMPMPDQQTVDRAENIDWGMIVIEFCMEAVVDIALQSVQHQDQNHEYWTVHLLSLLILITSAALFVAKFMHPKFGVGAQVLERVGLLLAVSSYCHAVSIPLPHALKCITWATFGISLLAVFICKY